MIKITPEDLVRCLYNETSEQKAAALKAAFETDWNLRETYEQFASAKNSLDEINMSPRPETVNNILNYAAKKQEQVHSH